MMLAASIFFKKLWAWIKRNWKFIIGLMIPCAFFIIARRRFDYTKVIDRINEDYQKEINVIDESHRIEKEKKEIATEKYNAAIIEIEKKFEEKNKALDAKKKKDIKRAIEKNIEDPDAITRRISEITGFKVHI